MEVTGSSRGDSPLLPTLVKQTAMSFNLREVSADKAYGSRRNHNVIRSVGAEPFIPFQDRHNHTANCDFADDWNESYDKFRADKDEWYTHYHKRSNVETTFSMVKRKFTHYLRSKTMCGKLNEILCIIICHNILVLVNQILGGATDYCAAPQVAQ